jgi:hypothetical protein
MMLWRREGPVCNEILRRKVLDMGQDPNTAKPHKMSVKLPWELTTTYSEVLKSLSLSNPNLAGGGNKSDDEDEDELEAHEDSLRRLKVRLATAPAVIVADWDEWFFRKLMMLLVT